MRDNIALEQEQEQLFCRVVEAARNVPREKRREFIVLTTHDGDFLMHPGIRGDQRISLLSKLTRGPLRDDLQRPGRPLLLDPPLGLTARLT